MKARLPGVPVPALAASLLALLGLGAELSAQTGPGSATGSKGTVKLQLLGVNDLHGGLEPSVRLLRARDGSYVGVGGAAFLASHLRRAAAAAPGRTITVHAGDMVGASPLISSYFHDEPSVRAMNLMGFDLGTLGNHEFDEGGAEMLRLLRGGRRHDGRQWKRDARGRRVDTSSPSFAGVGFPYVAANTVDRRGRLVLPPYRIVERAGVKVGFIGVTTGTAPRYLLARYSSRLRFLDISDAVNRYARELRRRGVRAIVVLAHAGARQRGTEAAGGEIVSETRQMSDDVDVVVAGHTHSWLNLRVPDRKGHGYKLVVEAFAFGTAYDKVDLTLDRRTGEVLRKSASTPRTWHDEVRPDPRVEALVRRYHERIAPVAGRVVGDVPRPFLRRPSPAAGRSPNVGMLAARAQRALAHADLAFVNPGNVRADLPAGPVTFEQLFGVEPFEHRVLRMTLTGADVEALLEQQFRPGGTVRLCASGLRYRYDGANGKATDVVLADGRGLDPAATYSVAANELLATGARFSVLRDRGRGKRAVGTDLEALARYVHRQRRSFATSSHGIHP